MTPDENDFTLPPGNVDAAGDVVEDDDADDNVADIHQDKADAAVEIPPTLPTTLETLKVPELKEHLRWRGLGQSGTKSELRARLEQAIKDGVQLIDAPCSSSGRAAAKHRAESAAWEDLDPAKISRPTYNGEDKFVPNPALGFTPDTHPFEFMNAFYPKSVRDTEVENSNRYRHHLAAEYREIYPMARPIDTKTNSLAHSILICQGLHPVPDQRVTLFRRSFAFKGTRPSPAQHW